MTNIETANDTMVFRCVNFRLGDEWYGQDIRHIQEVNRAQSITEVPGAPEYILGVINLRGSVIPVMDLRRRLGMPTVQLTKKSRVIVIEFEGSRLGLLVDSVHHVLDIPYGRISDPPESTITERNRFINGIGQIDDRFVFFINIERIFNEEFRKESMKAAEEVTIT